MRIGIPKESAAGERRVAGTPETVAKLVKLGFAVSVEREAGALASFPNDAYASIGAEVVDGDAAWSADLVLKVCPPTPAEVERLTEGAHLMSFLWPAQNAALLDSLAARKITALAMDCVPRISRAQKLDALSSMANISGYRAIIEAANVFGSFFTGQFTAAGKVPPAKVLVIGAGVAGLAAIGAAKGLGAQVRAFDTRAAVKEQVESMGATFLEVDFEEDGDGKGGYAKVMSPAFIKAEMDLFYEQAAEVDIVVTTALIPGRPAPKLWEARAVERMKPGSVVVDMAASQGGNCELTVPNEAVVKHGVTLIGYTDLASRLATTASHLYGNNLVHLIKDMGGSPDGYKVDLEDVVVRGTLVLQDGALMWPPPAIEPSPKPVAAAPKAAPVVSTPKAKSKAKAKTPATVEAPAKKSPWGSIIGLGLVALWLVLRFWKGDTAPDVSTAAFVQHLTVFVLACFIGWQVVWSVTAALHTPLMSVTNAISGIIIVGGMLQARGDSGSLAVILGCVAVLFATINIAGGFLVTHRMLKMFRK